MPTIDSFHHIDSFHQIVADKLNHTHDANADAIDVSVQSCFLECCLSGLYLADSGSFIACSGEGIV